MKWSIDLPNLGMDTELEILLSFKFSINILQYENILSLIVLLQHLDTHLKISQHITMRIMIKKSPLILDATRKNKFWSVSSLNIFSNQVSF